MTDNFIELSEVLASLDPEYLAHHGIKGQKWGVEHGPPYPLKEGVSSRIKKAAKSVKDRVESNRQKKAAKKEAKEEKRRQTKPTLQDKIKQMSDEELRQKTERLRLENAYKRELPREKEGESWMKQMSNSLNTLKTLGDSVAGLVETGKKLGKAFGLDEGPKGNDESTSRRAGESLKDYTTRMAQLASLKKSRDALGVNTSTSSASKVSSDGEKKKKGKPKSNSDWYNS